MFTKFGPIWIIAKRELTDQLRDWRMIAPMGILILFFPFLANEFARRASNFIAQYGGEAIIDRLVPFSLLIIGFFPISVSLVVALEAFVGEKERGTIEPILSAPLEDWQIYFGKLISGVIPPLVTSYASFGIYLLLVMRQNLTLPTPLVFLQILLLTTAHAFLMVSGAIVVSVQSTSVKAANLLASFIVIPVAILLEGEAGLLFWGNEHILWWAILGVLIGALLIIRLGLAHFQREYFIGREVDEINLRWLGRTFWQNFRGDARSISEWYRVSVGGALKKIFPAALVLLFVAGLTIFLSYRWTAATGAKFMETAPQADVEKIKTDLLHSPDLREIRERVNAPYLFMNNTRAMVVIFVVGIFTLGVLGVMAYMLNISLIGGLFGAMQVLGLPAWKLFLGGVLPHGIFELPAFLIGCAAVLYCGVSFVTPQAGKSFGETGVQLFAEWCKLFVGVIVPLMALAAVIEAHVTPYILAALAS
ncbi:MAG: stage II sporulation protein M [Anaerolineales bacterium]|nr:stage II sporulation protein M [Anaerolineales bacterium]